MFLRLLVLVAISLLSKKTVCQEQIDQSKRMAVVHGMIDSYNQHNYRAMKKPWVGIAKLFLSKKKFEAEFSPTFQRFGEATIDTVTYSSKYEYVAKLKMEKSATTPLYYSFIFSERGKLQGFGQTYPPLIYKKRISSTPINSVSFSQRLDSLLEKKYLHGKTKSFNGNIMVLDQGKVIYKKTVAIWTLKQNNH